MNKEKRIKAETERLFNLFVNLDENQKQTAAGLIRSAAFLSVSLEDLEAIINENGYLDEYENGASQSGVKISAAVQAYATLNAKYQSTIQKLLKIVPPAPRKPREKSAEEIAAEQKAIRERAEQQEYERKQRERETAMTNAFCEAYKGKPQTVDAYREFKEQWEREHPEI